MRSRSGFGRLRIRLQQLMWHLEYFIKNFTGINFKKVSVILSSKMFKIFIDTRNATQRKHTHSYGNIDSQFLISFLVGSLKLNLIRSNPTPPLFLYIRINDLFDLMLHLSQTSVKDY